MKQKFLLKTMLLLCALVAGSTSVWAEDDTYNITFKTAVSDPNNAITTSKAISEIVESGSLDYVKALITTEKIYAPSKEGLKVGSSSATGTFEFSVADAYKDNITSIEIKSAQYGTDTGTLSLFVNGESTAVKTSIAPADGGTHTFATPQTVSSIKITTNTKRAYVSEIILTKADSRIAIATISGISPTSLMPTDEGTFDLTAVYAEGKSASDATITWATSDDDVIMVDDESGEYMAIDEGTADITVTITPKNTTDYKAVSKKFSVTVAKGDADLSFTGSASYTVATGASFDAPSLNNPHGLTVTYSSNNTDAATVNTTTGAVTIGSTAGSATITAAFAGNDKYNAGNASYTINVTAAEIYTATFKVNGTTIGTQDAAESTTFAFPSVENLGSMKFVGWSKTQATPSLVNTATETMSNNTTYYAVFAEGSSVVDEITQSVTNVTGTTYTSFEDVSDKSSAVYKGICAGDKGSVQLRTKNSEEGLVTTTSGGKAKKVVVAWHGDTSAGRSIGIYGKNSAYTEASELYNALTQGALLGNLAKGSTELVIDGDYEYIGIRSNDGALYLTEIDITWENIDEGTYTTSIDPVDVVVTSVGYATFASEFPLDFTSASVKAYIATANGRTGVTFAPVTKVPANTGVLLYKDGGAEETVPVLIGAADATTGNVFKVGTGAAVASVDGDLHNYVLNKPSVSDPIGFYQAAGLTVPVGKAYIQIDYATVAAVKEFIALPGMEDDADGLERVQDVQEVQGAIFNLAGQRLQKIQKGINIVNGKKILY